MRSSLVVILIFVFSTSCIKQACSSGVKATMKDLSGLDGCGYVLELEDGTQLEPINLETFDFQPKDGQRLRITYDVVTGTGSICMVGDQIEITCITER
jgi:hypothetical protein